MGKLRIPAFIAIGILSIAALPLAADTRFTIRRMERNQPPPGVGECDIRLQVDDQVEVTVRGDEVFIHTLSGRDARDDGSECNMPLPDRDVEGFKFEVKERRGDIQMVEGPGRDNGGRVLVRIHDGPSGFGRYIFRLTWMMRQGGPPPPPPERRDGDFVGDVRIIDAVWGAPGQNRDVSRLLRERMRDGHLHIRASNEEMGFDPAVGVVKMLIVNYEIRGRRKEARIPEGEFLELP
jgi:hypothetical protein